ncbi:hypothetical protein [Streptomyces mirabilis]|uniref:hypothetical protein n=1 Tax=Streptomyces mirabilis TaxID=68239 RepID=UPI003667B5DF
MIIDVTYGEGWDAASRTVLGPMSRQRASDRDAAGEPYAVVLREEGRPQPVAVLHIAWAHGYFGVWAYDERGRRTREFDLRRLEPEHLFLRHVARWRYDTEDLPEFAEQAGRVRVDLYPNGRGRKVSEPQGSGGGSLHTMGECQCHERGDGAARRPDGIGEAGRSTRVSARASTTDARTAASTSTFTVISR